MSGANRKAKDNDGRTALDMAVYAGEEVVELLK